MYCKNCGKQIDDIDSIFCSNCGHKIPKSVPEIEPAHKNILIKVVAVIILIFGIFLLYLGTVNYTMQTRSTNIPVSATTGTTPIPTLEANPTTVSTPMYTTPVPTIITPIPTSSTPISTNLTILTSDPKDKIVNSSINNQSTFSITTNQLADITWRQNGERVQFDPHVNTSNYTTTASVTGILTINVTAESVNGSISREWIWNIKKGS